MTGEAPLAEKSATKGEQTRAGIIDAAQALFVERGYHGTSMRQIAERAGLALGGIYNHFQSKEDLFVAVIDAYHPYHDIIPIILTSSGETAEEYLRNVGLSVLESLKDRPRLLNLVLIELVEFEGRHIPILVRKVVPLFAEALGKVQRYRSALRPLPLPLIIRTFVGLFFSHHVIELLIQNVPMADPTIDWVDGIVDIYLHGVLQPSSEA